MNHSTNYYNSFIAVAEDSKVDKAVIPPSKKEGKSLALLQYEKVINAPYCYTSDEVLFDAHACKKDISPDEYEAEREKYFSKGQPCFRASPLTKQYGWGVHSDSEGKVALYAMESAEYEAFTKDSRLKQYRAMRTKRS